jgi:hypothetical protein
VNLDRALDYVRNAFYRRDGEMSRGDFSDACSAAGVYSRENRRIIQATFEACGLRVRKGCAKELSTDIFIWEGWKE